MHQGLGRPQPLLPVVSKPLASATQHQILIWLCTLSPLCLTPLLHSCWQLMGNLNPRQRRRRWCRCWCTRTVVSAKSDSVLWSPSSWSSELSCSLGDKSSWKKDKTVMSVNITALNSNNYHYSPCSHSLQHTLMNLIIF